MTPLELVGLVGVGILILSGIVSVVLFLLALARAKPHGGRPPWPMPGGEARPRWREQWDPGVSLPPDSVTREWDEAEARQVAEQMRQENTRP